MLSTSALIELDGDDTVDAGAGWDRVCRGGGRDRLLGGCGNDTIIGGLGNDFIKAGVRADVMAGNVGDSIDDTTIESTLNIEAGSHTEADIDVAADWLDEVWTDSSLPYSCMAPLLSEFQRR